MLLMVDGAFEEETGDYNYCSTVVKINALTNPAMLFLGSERSSMFDPDTDGEFAWRSVVNKYYGQKAFYLYSKP